MQHGEKVPSNNKRCLGSCLWFFSFLTAAFVCVGRVWRGDYQPLTMRYATFGTFCVVALVLLVGTILLHEAGRCIESATTGRLENGNGRLVTGSSRGCLAHSCGYLFSIEWVGWRYGIDLMEEWEMARWRARASLLFVSSLYAPELEYRYLGGQKEIFENGARDP